MSRLVPRVLVVAVAGVIAGAVLARPVFAQNAADRPQDDGTFTLTPSAYVQFDWRAFPDWDVTPGTGRLNRDVLEVRRLRAGVEGRWKKVTFEASIDPLDDDGVFVKDAYAQVRLSRALRLRVGQFKLPGTRDYDSSASRLDFLERTPLASSIAVARDIGARVDGRLGRVTYEAGLFAGDGIGRDDRAGITGAGRAVWTVRKDLELGGALSAGRTHAVDNDAANGMVFRAASGYRFAEAVYVQGLRLRTSADVEWSPGRWRLTAEALRLRDERAEQGLDREDLPAAVGTGFSASLRRRIVRRVEGAVRFDYLAFDDAGDGSTAESVRARATNIRPRGSQGLTLGSTWTVRPWLRVLGNVGAERYTEARSAPEVGKQGTYLTAGTRLQIEWR